LRPSKRFWLLLLILSIAGFLRLYRLTTIPPGLYRDEAIDGCNALEVLQTGRFQAFYPEDNGREGLYVNVAAVFVRFLGNRAWVLRLPAAVFGILTVWGVYRLAAEMASPEAGLLAAFFLATSFWHVVFSRIAFRAIAAPLLLTWALYFLLSAIRRQRQSVPYVGYVLAAGIFYGLGFYTYIAWRVTPLLVAGILLASARKAGRLPAAFCIAAALVASPLAFYFATHPGSFWGHVAQLSVLRTPRPAWQAVLNTWRTARMFFTRGDGNWRHNIAWRPELFWPVAILFLIGVARGWRKWQLAIWWMAVAALPAILSAGLVPHALRSILMLPPAVMLAAEGASRVHSWLAGRLPRRWLAGCSAAFLLALACEPYHTYFHRWATNPNVPPAFDQRAVDMAEEINRMARETPKYVVTLQEPLVAAPVMFLTRSYTARQQRETNIHYVESDSCQAAVPSPAKVFCLDGAQGSTTPTR